MGLVAPVAASQPRSNYALNVIINDTRTGEIGLVLQLQSLNTNTSFLYWAANITSNVTLGPQLAWASNGPAGGFRFDWQNNVSGTTYFNYTVFIAAATRQAMANEPNVTFFATFTAVVTYSDNLGGYNRTIVRTLSFPLNYNPPAPPPLISLFTAAVVGVGSAGAVGTVAYVRRRARLEELYLMHDSGMLIRHWSRAEGSQHDSDIMSGMLMVLQEFVRDTWKGHGDEDAPLEQLRFGPQRVLLARGSHTVLAAVVRGRYVNGLPLRLSQAIEDFERTNAERLADWNGNVDVFPKVDLIGDAFLGSHRHSAA